LSLEWKTIKENIAKLDQIGCVGDHARRGMKLHAKQMSMTSYIATVGVERWLEDNCYGCTSGQNDVSFDETVTSG
jgi:hypothetical protein